MHRHPLWLVCLLSLATFSYAKAEPTKALSPSLPLSGRVYILDPGHGGEDTGTKHEWPSGQQGKHRTYLYEKQFTLGLVLELRRQIEAKGGIVISTVIEPDNLIWLPFGKNRIPNQGAEFFNLPGRPPIVAKAAGLSKRLEVGERTHRQYPATDIHWLSLHYDWVPPDKDKTQTSGTRLFFSTETQETTTVKVQRWVNKTVKINGKKVKQRSLILADSIVAIRPSAFVLDLAQAFTDAGWLRTQEQRPVIASGKVRFLYIIHGEKDPKRFGRRRHKQADHNAIDDRVLIEYANFNSPNDWARLQTVDGSFQRFAEITVAGLIRHAQRIKP